MLNEENEKKKEFLRGYRKSLKREESICDDMDPRAFCRVNKQYVVAREHITSIVVWSNSRLLVSMDTETPEPVFLSKNRAAEFKKWITG